MSPSLRLPRHRATTAQVCSIYPFAAGGGLPPAGVYLGTDVLAGGSTFCFDPFRAYGAGLVTNPNMVVLGEPGVGKSATVKVLVHRLAGVLGRWVAIADPKGEYAALAERLGLSVVRLAPGGTQRLNPLDAGGAGGDDGPEELARRQGTMVAALLGSVLGRDLSPLEDATVGWDLAYLARRRRPATLADLATVLADPPAEVARRARLEPAEMARSTEAATFALGKLLDRSLRGMFDGPTNVRLDADGPGVVVDLSGVHGDPEALRLVMVATTAWLQGVLARPGGPRRLLVLDEAWSLLATERTARFLQASVKLARAYGVANVAVIHRLSDLRAQADDGTATAKVAAGLLADSATRVVFRQSSDQAEDARRLLGLTGPETALVSRLGRGRALWKVGAHTAVVAHHLGAAEREICDTDSAMRG
ncbi:MAG TPA: DUF87 domain-containing protein [Acidimicrobiales bacterium]|nr:DUF87 domain-containing protein [Acidimicrobiales bacterium]